jgi:hypothetical protein
MADPQGHRLIVNVSAAEAKRRLKGFGHGVRKVRSAGRKQAVIIHTAEGKNLRELQDKFADVGCSSTEADLSRTRGETPMSDIPTGQESEVE